MERDEIRRRQVNAPAGLRAPEGQFVSVTVNIDVAPERIDGSAAIEPRFQALQPQDAMHNRAFRLALPGKPDRLPPSEHGSDWIPSANFTCDPVQPERRLL